MRRFLSSFFSRLLPWLVLVHALVFAVFWLTNNLFYASTNDYLADMLGRRLDYVSLLLWVSFFIAAWSIIRLLLLLFKKTYKLARFFSWVYGLVSLVYVVFFYGSFKLLFSESPVQLARIGQLLGYFRFFLDGAILLAVALLDAFLLRAYYRRNSPGTRQQIWGSLALTVLIVGVLWSLPLLYPPSSMARGALPDKPLIIAHRGASMLAPENTLGAASLAAELGAYGLETDIHISRDGNLFLLHDETFDRTTDVKTIFPGRQEEPAEDFTQAEIGQLNAGRWFLDQDPFLAVRRGLVTPEQEEEYQHQVVNLLTDWLDIVRTKQMVFIFDLKQPPEGHPFADSYFDLVIDQLHEARIDPLVWFLVDATQLETVHDTAPEMLPAFGVDYRSPPEAGDLAAQGYRIVNAEYGIGTQWIEAYQDAGLWVNLYTVDEPWQFSRLWLLGVDSITTSNVGEMVNLEKPILMLPYDLYALLWSVVGLAGLGIMIGLLYPFINPRALVGHYPPTG